MTSQSDIEQTSFLENCIGKKRKIRDSYEALGLYSEEAETRKDPVFPKIDANNLQKEIKDLARAFRISHQGDEDTLPADLIKEDAFVDEADELGQRYGPLIWGRVANQPWRWGKQQVTQELRWENQADQKLIRFHIRCWIIGHVVRARVSGKGKGRMNASVRDPTESEQSDYEVPPPPEATTCSDLPFRAPEVPCMTSHAECPETDTIGVRAGPIHEKCLDSAHKVQTRSPQMPNKRKAPNSLVQTTPGKLQKVAKETQGSKGSPWFRQRDVYAVPRSPDFASPTHPSEVIHRARGEDSSDTGRNHVPPRDATVETETVFDPDEVMADRKGLLLDTNIANARGDSPLFFSPTAGPSGTYRNPLRLDSVIPHSPPHHTELCETDQIPHDPQSTTTLASAPSHQTELSTLSALQVNKLRHELFKLLLSYLNNINQFAHTSYESSAESRLEDLLYQFWHHDAEAIRAHFGPRTTDVQATWQRWMHMRYTLNEFQCTTGFFGKPGDEWREHLRGMDRVARAKASIAFVDLKSCEGVEGGLEERADEDLAVVFDLMTCVEGCNGVEEFGALRVYNEGLREWFM